jgi:hypothetical protein
MLLSYSLSIGYVDLVCLRKLLVIETLVSQVSFGSLCVKVCNVELHCRVAITHRLMGLLSVFIGLWNKCYVVIAVLSKLHGVFCFLNVNLHLTIVCKIPMEKFLMKLCLALHLQFLLTPRCHLTQLMHKTLLLLDTQFTHRLNTHKMQLPSGWQPGQTPLADLPSWQ